MIPTYREYHSHPYLKEQAMNNVINNYISVFKNFSNFSGRAGRREYWMFFAANFAACMILSVIDAATGIPVLGLLYILAALIPGIAVTIRRLHDGDRSGWWMLVAVVPILGALGLLVLMALPGTPAANRFGQAIEEGEISLSAA